MSIHMYDASLNTNKEKLQKKKVERSTQISLKVGTEVVSRAFNFDKKMKFYLYDKV